MVKELEKRLDLDVDELLYSPKLKLTLSPGELDKLLLEFYNNVSEGPGGDVLRMIGGGANVGRQKYYMKQQALRLKRLQQQEEKNQKLLSDEATAITGPRNSFSLPPEFLEDVGTGESSIVTKKIKQLLKRNFIPNTSNPRNPTSGVNNEGDKIKSTKKTLKKDTPMMSLKIGYSRSYTMYLLPKTSFLRTTSPIRSKLPTLLI